MMHSETSGAVPTQWRPIARAKTYQLVLDRIEEQILTAELRPGDRLPPERELAGQLGVSRPAVREALRALQVQGVLQSCVGNGPDAGTTVVAAPGLALARLLRLHVALTSFPADDATEVRVLLERTVGKLAAHHAAASDLQRVAGLMAQLADPALYQDALHRLDAEVHHAIAAAAGSPLLAELTDGLRQALAPVTPAAHGPEAYGPEAAGFEATLDQVRSEFRTLYDRLAARDGAGLANVLDLHARQTCARISSRRGWTGRGPEQFQTGRRVR
jgi:GntR family transcriptional regulator, transcriptional repressor for pyruvate dehydrogenase complex